MRMRPELDDGDQVVPVPGQEVHLGQATYELFDPSVWLLPQRSTVPIWQLPISAGLEHDIEAWCLAHEGPDPCTALEVQGPHDPRFPPRLAAEGLRLLARMQRELGPGWLVTDGFGGSGVDADADRCLVLCTPAMGEEAGLLRWLPTRSRPAPERSRLSDALLARIADWVGTGWAIDGTDAAHLAEGAELAAEAQLALLDAAVVRFNGGRDLPRP